MTVMSQLLLAPIAGGVKALGPSFGVNGESLANGWEFGESYPELTLPVDPPVSSFPRSAQVLPLASGTILSGCTLEYNTGIDNSARSFAVRSSTDGGKTWGVATGAVVVSGYVGGSIAVGHNAVNGWCMGQLPNGTIVLVYTLMPYGSTTAGAWLDFSGNTPAQTKGVKIYSQTGTESSGVVTWSAATEVTSQFKVVDDRNQMNVTALANNGSGAYRLTVNGNTDAMTANHFYIVRLAGITGTNASTMNFAQVAKAFYVKAISTTSFDIVSYDDGTAAPAFNAGTTLSGATALPEFAWVAISPGGGCVIRSGSAHAGDFVIPAMGRWDANAQGTATAFSAFTSDGATFGMSTQTTANTTIAEVEPGICEQSTGGNLYMTMRQGSGSTRLRKLSTDGGRSWGAQAAVTELISTPTLGCVLNAGGANLVLIAPNSSDASKRTRLTAWASADDGATWPIKRVLNWGTSGYSHAALSKGTIYFAAERDYVDDIFAGAPGRIEFGKTNLTAIKAAATNYDEVRYYFNDLPSGYTALTNYPAIRDWGNTTTGVCFNHHAVVKGVPVYAAGGLTFAVGDYLTLASGTARDSFYDSDYLATDNGSFTVEWEGSIASNGFGVIAGGNSGVGTGTKGWTLSVSNTGIATLTLDDGTHHPAALPNAATVNDGSVWRVYAKRDTVAGQITCTVYNPTTGAVIDSTTTTDTTTTTQGSISNATGDKCLMRYADTTTGRMSQSCTTRMFRFVRGVVAPLPFPTVVPTAETFAAAPTGSPGDTAQIPAGKLTFWGFRTDNHFGNRSRSMASPAVSVRGWPLRGILDASGNGYFNNSGGVAQSYAIYDSDATVQGSWWFPKAALDCQLDSRTATPTFDDIANFTKAWGIGFAVNVPAGSDGTAGKLFNTLGAGTRGWELFTNINGTDRRFEFVALNALGTFSTGSICCIGGVSNAQYTYGSWYYFALTFSGTGGAGYIGMKCYCVPLTGTPLLSGAVTGNSVNTAWNPSGVTTASSGTAQQALAIGDTSNLFNARIKSAFICVGYQPTDANILSFCNDAIK